MGCGLSKGQNFWATDLEITFADTLVLIIRTGMLAEMNLFKMTRNQIDLIN